MLERRRTKIICDKVKARVDLDEMKFAVQVVKVITKALINKRRN